MAGVRSYQRGHEPLSSQGQIDADALHASESPLIPPSNYYFAKPTSISRGKERTSWMLMKLSGGAIRYRGCTHERRRTGGLAPAGYSNGCVIVSVYRIVDFWSVACKVSVHPVIKNHYRSIVCFSGDDPAYERTYALDYLSWVWNLG
jgi:hypothetical protein